MKSQNELKTTRETIGITQIQAANLLNISRRKYQNYESLNTTDASEGLIVIYEEILEKLKSFNIDGDRKILSIPFIKEKVRKVLVKYADIKCAYLFGSYARKEATIDSDVDILIVSKTMSGFALGHIVTELIEALGKPVDLINHETVIGSELFIRKLLLEGIKIYGQGTC